MGKEEAMREVSERNDTSPAGRGRTFGSIRGALILIGLGIIFLLQQIGGFHLRNWWALFILIPVVGAFESAARIARSAGRLNYAAWSAFYGGLFPLLVALMFLFELNWATYWPLFLILPGFGMLVSGVASWGGPGAAMNQLKPWAVTVGLAATLLGLVFVFSNLGGFDPAMLVPAGLQWWGLFILLAAAGGVLSALLLLARGRSGGLVIANLLAAAVVGLTGAVALLGLDWNLMNLALPILLIVGGAALLLGFFARGGGVRKELSPSEGDRAAEER
jgi:hypothetical protein